MTPAKAHEAKSKPLLFSGPMVRALLEGRKTQTRRIVKPQPVYEGNRSYGDSWAWNKGQDWFSGVTTKQLCSHAGLGIRAPHQIGSEIWVREAFRLGAHIDDRPAGMLLINLPTPFYEADGEKPVRIGRYRHARFMPRWASRITLKVTDVRVQRLQDISEEDALKEGIRMERGLLGESVFWDYLADESASPVYFGAIDSYRTLWESINGDGSWDVNPWVFAYTFEVKK